MPHITEEIWHTLTQQPANSKQSLSLQAYPTSETHLIDPQLEEQFDLLIETIRTIRNLRQEADVKPGLRVTINLQSENPKERQILTNGQSYIKDLAKVETLTITGEQKQQTIVGKKTQISWTQIAALIGVIFLLRIGYAAASAVEEVPLLGTFFEVVGFGYLTWFITQNLLSAQARQKFWQQLYTVAIGNKNSQPQEPQPEPQPEPEKAIAGLVGTIQVLLPLEGVVDIKAFNAKLQKRLSKIEAEINSLQARLNKPNFVEQAPKQVVQGVRDTLAEAEKQAEILRDRLRRLT